MNHKNKFCLWLLDTLQRKPLNLQEIQAKWLYASCNPDQIELSERTFNRYRRMAESQYQVQIKCNRSLGNRYEIENKEEILNDRFLSWELTSFRLGNLSREIRDKSIVVMEPAPPAADLLEPILECIESKKIMRMVYKSHYKEAKEVSFYPVFVRLCGQRWYVVGVNCVDNKERIYAFERIRELNIESGKDTKFVKKNIKINPKDYFANSYGVIKEGEPVLIKIRAFWPQNAYLKDVPLHHSQEIVEECDGYTDFEVFIRPTYDFIQALLSNREQLVVIEPQSLRLEMINILENMIGRYEA
ncbi:helix-turn-helix transcriptional regulator [Sphingobacterium mizutaii]|uniref:helix-turn-helix transcriptional regulator n=1 Tax=Sphingobacterium mizutaii TaxID=1010 RepID=UPI00162A0B41|nr:WYL domain-containing protein [Sphingobacterium mizutaii]